MSTSPIGNYSQTYTQNSTSTVQRQNDSDGDNLKTGGTPPAKSPAKDADGDDKMSANTTQYKASGATQQAIYLLNPNK